MTKVCFVLAAIVLLPSSVFAATRQVASGGANDSDCVAQPCRSVSYALAQAEPGDVIEVGPGRFEAGIEVHKAVTLRGAQAGVDARRRSGVPETIVGGSLRVLASGVGIDGFTIDCGDCTANVYAEPASDLHVVNNVFKGGVSQLNLVLSVAPVDVRFNDFQGADRFTGQIPMPMKTTGVVVTPMVFELLHAPEYTPTLIVDSNRFTTHSSAMVLVDDVVSDGSVAITNNQFALANSGFAVDLTYCGGIRIAGNSISGGGEGGLRIANSSSIEASHNRFAGAPVDIQLVGTSQVLAENNWYGCNGGPPACGVLLTNETSSIDAAPWLVMTVSASPSRIVPGRSSVIVADLNHNSDRT